MTTTEGPPGPQLRMTAATVVMVVVVLMSALLAFITTPPQPLILLFGILLAVVIYYAARNTGRLGLSRGGPHEEELRSCADCSYQYCVGCHSACPQCRSVHVQPAPAG
ncbi:MAG: hypothetical protein R3291_01485 [Thermoplasmata archaeon]|nr:hypothetical protein [Thermoplasmata archaeon]